MFFQSNPISGGEKWAEICWLSDELCDWLTEVLQDLEVEGKIGTVWYRPLCLPKEFSHFEEYFGVREGGTVLTISPKVDYDKFSCDDRASASRLLLAGLTDGLRKFLERGRYKKPLAAMISQIEQVRIEDFVASIRTKKMDRPRPKDKDPLTVEKLEAVLADWPDHRTKAERKLIERHLVRLKEEEARTEDQG
ncbi:hypothetical protein [Qipengyuania vesicularis]|uniref:hypothetical protein n=1 Tax=Qipengyuania vesicularis TaxID=2867232 RepID=UPI001C88C8D6|nr:hypothetical protein [Qipengyuania vesicularis]MBX7526636.1 hypothetical protein [Qipengyuania vesicularis]